MSPLINSYAVEIRLRAQLDAEDPTLPAQIAKRLEESLAAVEGTDVIEVNVVPDLEHILSTLPSESAADFAEACTTWMDRWDGKSGYLADEIHFTTKMLQDTGCARKPQVVAGRLLKAISDSSAQYDDIAALTILALMVRGALDSIGE